MKNLIIPVLIVFTMTTACQRREKHVNPFLIGFDTPHGVPPFDEIVPEHFMPAFEEGMQQQNVEVEAIVAKTEPHTFENTIAALEYSGELLSKVSMVFFNTNSANTNEEIQAIAREVAPLLSQHRDNIVLNHILFERIKSVYENMADFGLNAEQMRLTSETYKHFKRSGAKLDKEKQARLREINQQLSVLSLRFGENVLAEKNHFQLWIENEADLSGLPPAQIEAAAQAAKNTGQEGKWLFTLHNASSMPFLYNADNREVRKKMKTGHINRGNNNNERDNKDIVLQTVNLRIERAGLLGYENHAHFILEESMVDTQQEVMDFINRLWEPTMKVAAKEAQDLQNLATAQGHDYLIEPWDWRYYTEKLRKERFDLDEEQLRPYFSLEKVTEGIFELARRLWGLQFVSKPDLPRPHPDAVAYEVLEENGDFIGILYMDFHPRASKRSGAWMSSFRQQFRKPDGTMVYPIVTLVCNFTPPTATTPSLLTFDEVRTYFHEFGHGLHGLLSNVTYRSLSGTNVPRDFVELPAQIMEHWASEPEFLRVYARHYQTGEVIPDELIERLNAARHFNQGFITGEFLASAFLDMAYHTRTSELTGNPVDFEVEEMKKIGLIPQIMPRHRSTHFLHIFSGGYSAGYYSYIWSAKLDADAFEAFREAGIFDRPTAERFREHILERGGTDEPLKLYIGFRGKEPQLEPLLRVRGLI